MEISKFYKINTFYKILICCLLAVYIVSCDSGVSKAGTTSSTNSISSTNSSNNTVIVIDYSKDTGIIGHPAVFGGATNGMMESHIPIYKTLGTKLIRSDVYLSDLFPESMTLNSYLTNESARNPDNWDWSKESWPYGYYNNGYQIILIMSYNAKWLSYSGNNSGVPLNWWVYQDVIGKIYKHFESQIYAVEIWNEPDLDQFLDVSNSPYESHINSHLDAYLDIYQVASYAIKTINPAAKVGGPIVSKAWMESWADAMLSNPSIAGRTDFLSYHHYDHGTSEESYILRWKNVAAKYGRADLPIYVSEYNYGADSDGYHPINSYAESAVGYMAARLSSMYVNGVAGSNYYAFNDYGNNPKNPYFSTYDDGTPTPKMMTFNLMSNILALGSGDCNIVTTNLDSTQGGAIKYLSTNSSAVAFWLVNNTPNFDDKIIHFKGLIPRTSYRIDLYEASGQYTNNLLKKRDILWVNESGEADYAYPSQDPYSILGANVYIP